MYVCINIHKYIHIYIYGPTAKRVSSLISPHATCMHSNICGLILLVRI